MSRTKNLPKTLRMECIYILKGHADRLRAVKSNIALTKAEEDKYTAVEAALNKMEPILKRPVLDAITERIAYEKLNVPCGRQTFYRMRNALLLSVAQELGYVLL